MKDSCNACFGLKTIVDIGMMKIKCTDCGGTGKTATVKNPLPVQKNTEITEKKSTIDKNYRKKKD